MHEEDSASFANPRRTGRLQQHTWGTRAHLEPVVLELVQLVLLFQPRPIDLHKHTQMLLIPIAGNPDCSSCAGTLGSTQHPAAVVATASKHKSQICFHDRASNLRTSHADSLWWWCT